jgi:V/A-type H+-transporting ATPase subunit K
MSKRSVPRTALILLAGILVLLVSMGGLLSLTIFALVDKTAATGEVSPEQATASEFYYKAISMLSVGMAFGCAVLAGGLGISIAGTAVASMAAEKPELSSLAMIITAFAEAIAIYGLVVVILMLGKI